MQSDNELSFGNNI